MAQYAPTIPRIDSDVFLVLCYDGEGSSILRESHLDGHLEYVERNIDRYLLAGPLKAPGTEPLIGSFFVVAAENADRAREIVAGDPYVTSGMYREIIVQGAVPAAGSLLGGVIWESADAIRDRAS